MEKYNGWTNRDTWLVVLWLENDYDVYMNTRDNKDVVLSLSDKDLIDEIILATGCTDKIDTSKVNVEEVREAIREL